MTTDLILGTAGHIDHGKTSLIAALTGVNTDRLPEEKKRGITIDLGFAELCIQDYRLGIVDVPGHERFVRNMLAGATGMDLAMLVVAADDSIKPQTREHLDILRLLNLSTGVIAVTKCDLIEPEWVELVEREISELVEGTFLASSPIIRTSAATGQGIDQLREALARAAAEVIRARPRGAEEGPFRLAIDRAFTITGHGTVVTGSVGSGRASVGDELVIEPGGIRVRVRGLQNHDRTTSRICRGQRAAINLAGIHHQRIERGHELATTGHLRPSRLVSVDLSLVPTAPRPLNHRARVRLHVGTAQLLATVLLLDTTQLKPGQSAMAQLALSEPAVSTWNQPFVIRSESPVQTIGGGQVLVPNAEKLRFGDLQALDYLGQLQADEPMQRASAALYFAGLRGWQPVDLARTAGMETVEQATSALKSDGWLLEIPVSPTRTHCVHRDVLAQLCKRIERTVATFHHKNPLRTSIDLNMVRQVYDYVDEAVLKHALASMQHAGRIQVSDGGVALEGHGPKLSQNERKLLARLIELYREAGLEPPTVKQVQQQATRNQNAVPQLIKLAAANGDLVQIHADYYLHTEVDREMRDLLARHFATGDGLTVSQIREILKTTRKYAVPYCEYLDRVGFTRRAGDLRFPAAPQAD